MRGKVIAWDQAERSFVIQPDDGEWGSNVLCSEGELKGCLGLDVEFSLTPTSSGWRATAVKAV